VTWLSPYVRHGILDLAEVRDAVLAHGRPQRDIWKFVQELAWRDYWRRVYGALGDRIWDDIEPYKTGVSAYAHALPADIAGGATGLACIDAFTFDLLDTGYVHNHARMYFAAYVVHHRRVRWQAGARFYLAHLLDGDPSSNDLSWQWVASTFGNSPYLFNRENLERYTDGVYCRRCPLASGGCPFDADYATLDARLFVKAPRAASTAPVDFTVAADVRVRPSGDDPAIVWVHPDALNDDGIARRTAPDAPVFAAAFDAMHARDAWSPLRRAFVDGSLAEMRVDARASGDDAAAIVAFARAAGARRVITTASPDPLIRAIVAQVARELPIVALDPPPFATLAKSTNLGRFSRYWKRAEPSAFEPTAAPDPRQALLQ
jgi:deoxyribodipyrimidine photo-lyase